MGLYSCNRSFSIPLGRGYSLVRENRWMTSILSNNNVCIHANVVRLSIGRDSIMGYAQSNGPGWEEACPTPGYFFVDAANGVVHQGLGVKELLEVAGLSSLDDAKLIDVNFWTVPRMSYDGSLVTGDQ